MTSQKKCCKYLINIEMSNAFWKNLIFMLSCIILRLIPKIPRGLFGLEGEK